MCPELDRIVSLWEGVTQNRIRAYTACAAGDLRISNVNMGARVLRENQQDQADDHHILPALHWWTHQNQQAAHISRSPLWPGVARRSSRPDHSVFR